MSKFLTRVLIGGLYFTHVAFTVSKNVVSVREN